MTLADTALSLATTLGTHWMANQLRDLASRYDEQSTLDAAETAAFPAAQAALARAIRAAEIYTLIGDGGGIGTDASILARIAAIKALRGSRHPGNDIIADIDAKLSAHDIARTKANEAVSATQVGLQLEALVDRAQRLAAYLAIVP